MHKTHIIIGTSAAGIGVLNKLRALDPLSTIICISDEKELPYNKCNLADYMSGIKNEAAVFTRPIDFFSANKIDLRLGKKVIAIKPDQRCVMLDDGQQLSYNTLFLGLGSAVPTPPIECKFDKTSFKFSDSSCDITHKGIFVFHTLADVNTILAFVAKHQAKNAIVVGAGLSGLECADALSAQGLNVTVIEKGNQVLSRQVDKQGSDLIEQYMKAKSVTLLKEESVVSIQGNERVQQISLASGTTLPADIVIVATGLKPRSTLAIESGIVTSEGYIVTDDFLTTNVPTIWAGGDCIMIKNQLTGGLMPSCTWSDAMLQGSIAAHGMAGQSKAYPGATIISSSSFFGIQFVTCGSINDEAEKYIIKRGEGFYKKLMVNDGYLKGFLLVGQVNQVPHLKRILLTGQKVNEHEL
jgi:phenylglyoxylate dehydrogenase epsilon subunit